MRLIVTYIVVNKVFAGPTLSYNKLVYRTLSFYVKNFGVQSSIDPYNPVHNQLISIDCQFKHSIIKTLL